MVSSKLLASFSCPELASDLPESASRKRVVAVVRHLYNEDLLSLEGED